LVQGVGGKRHGFTGGRSHQKEGENDGRRGFVGGSTEGASSRGKMQTLGLSKVVKK